MADLSFIRRLAEQATTPGPEKWKANQELITWFRSDPVSIVEALQAGAAVNARPGGLNHTRLHKALKALPDVKN